MIVLGCVAQSVCVCACFWMVLYDDSLLLLSTHVL